MAVDFRCESCGKLLVADGESGQVTCPHCKKVNAVPAGLASLPRPQVPPDRSGTPAQQPELQQPEEVVQQVHEEPDGVVMGMMANIMPLMISLFFHVGLLLVIIFLGTMLTVNEMPEEMIVQGVTPSPNPGGALTPSRSQVASETSVEKVSTTVRESALPSDTKPERSVLMAPGSSGTASSKWEAGGPSSSGPYSSFFGSGSNARCVVYVVDYTGSMYDVFDRVGLELATSIGRLDGKTQSFHVILYNEGVIEMPDKKLVPASDAFRLRAAEFISENSQPFGRSPSGMAQAIARAFQVLSRIPGGGKVIYLLTDNTNLPPLRDIQAVTNSLNKRKEVILNTFLFRPSNMDASKIQRAMRDMARIAKENSGTLKIIIPDY